MLKTVENVETLPKSATDDLSRLERMTRKEAYGPAEKDAAAQAPAEAGRSGMSRWVAAYPTGALWFREVA
jgi:hypothetical protein